MTETRASHDLAETSSTEISAADSSSATDAPRRSPTRIWWLLVLLLVLMNLAAWQRSLIADWLAGRALVAASNDDAPAVDRWADWARWVDADTPRVELALARIARRGGQLDEAQQHLRRARILGLNSEEADVEDTLAIAQGGSMSAAEQRLGELLENNRIDHTEVVEAYVQGYLRMRDFGSAMALLQAWASDHQQDPRPHSWIGSIYAEQRNDQAAEEAFRTALERDPQHGPAALGLGQLLADAKRTEEAIPWLRIAVAQPPKSASAAATLVQALRDEGLIDEADEVLESALQESPHDYRLLVEQANRQVELGEYEAAAEGLQPLIDEGTRRRSVHYAYASGLRGLGRAEEAAEHFAYAAEAAEATAKANQRIAEVPERPRDVELRYGIGQAHLEYGNIEDGLLWLMSVLELDPGHQPTHRALAEYYGTKVRDQPEFIGAYQRHRELAGPMPESEQTSAENADEPTSLDSESPSAETR